MKPIIALLDEQRQSYGPFVPECSQNHGKGMKIEQKKAFWTIVKKATFPHMLP